MIYYNFGRTYNKISRLDEAETAYKKTLQINDKFMEAYHNLGNVYLRLDRRTDAFDTLQKVLLLQPNDPGAKASLGMLGVFGQIAVVQRMR